MSLERRLSTRLFATSALALTLAAGVAHAGPPFLDRIVVMVMENKSCDQVRNQPSQPNYIAMGPAACSGYEQQLPCTGAHDDTIRISHDHYELAGLILVLKWV